MKIYYDNILKQNVKVTIFIEPFCITECMKMKDTGYTLYNVQCLDDDRTHSIMYALYNNIRKGIIPLCYGGSSYSRSW